MESFHQALNSAQQTAVQDTEGAVLLLAGAGSGKTRVLTNRIFYILQNRLASPREILAITFTNKAANEMRDRVVGMLGGDIHGMDMWICTIHSMCVRILRADIDRLGFDNRFSIYSEQDRERVLRRVLQEKVIPTDRIKEFLRLISSAKNNNLEPSECENSAEFCDGEFIDVYTRYDQTLKQNNSLDFDDLLTKTYRLLCRYADAREKYAERFRYIHVDEFQDTNKVQYELIKLLASVHGNVFAVGDDDQSIYGFRGAEVENMFEFKKDYLGCKVYKLEQNYRSTKKILEVANKVIAKNNSRMDKSLWTENNEGEPVVCRVLSDENDEAETVVSQIKKLSVEYGYKYSDFAILMRVNALTRPFEAECLKYGIPQRVYGGFKFYERKEIKDILAYMRVLVNPFDEESLLRIINVPKRAIGDTAVSRLIECARKNGETLFDVVLGINKNTEISKTTAARVAAFKDILLDLIQSAQLMPLHDFAEKLVSVTGLRSSVDDGTDEGLNKLLNVNEFLSGVKDFADKNEGAGIVEFVESVTLSSDIDAAENSGDCVSIATVHAVKGLEFKVVFIVGLEEGIFPISRASFSTRELDEERRLMYVAVTRARERLFVTRSRSRYLYGRRAYTLESKFFGDVKSVVAPVEQRRTMTNASGFSANRRFVEEPTVRKTMSYSDYANFKPGTKVNHTKFGIGTIVSASGSGASSYVDVAFAGLGIKTFALQFAPLEIVK